MKSCINPSKTSESKGIFSRLEVLELSLWLLRSSHCDKGLSCVHGQVHRSNTQNILKGNWQRVPEVCPFKLKGTYIDLNQRHNNKCFEEIVSRGAMIWKSCSCTFSVRAALSVDLPLSAMTWAFYHLVKSNTSPQAAIVVNAQTTSGTLHSAGASPKLPK